MTSIQSAEQLQQCILAATDPMSATKNTASSMLNHMSNTFPDGGSSLCVLLMKQTFEQSEVKTFNIQEQHQVDNVIFYTFTNLQRALSKLSRNSECIIEYQCRDELRRIIYHYILRHNGRPAPVRILPSFLRTKVSVVLALLIQVDFPDRWQNAFSELSQFSDSIGGEFSLVGIVRKDIFLRTLDGFCDEVVENTSIARNTAIKDYIRGLSSPFSPAFPVENSLSIDIINSIMMIYKSSIGSIYEPTRRTEQLGKLEMQKLPIMALSVLKRFIPWVDASIILNERIIGTLLECLKRAGPGDVDDENGDGSLPSQCAAESVECFKELVSKGMEERKKIEMITSLNLVQQIIESGVNLDTVDGTHINIVIRIAELLAIIGIDLLNFWDDLGMDQLASNEGLRLLSSQISLLFSLFFRCFAYDDIDVSGAVIPLASRIVSSLEREIKQSSSEEYFDISVHMPQLLAVMYEQMKYPSDFGFDYEDEDDAEEEMYRTELRKLNQTVIRLCPDMAMQFLCNALSQIQAPLSSAATNHLEAALRLVYHYSEGVRPVGTKEVLKNQMFRDVLVALHSSDVVSHSHREVVILYYDIVVRYAGILQDIPALLPNILTAISGSRGLQHEHPRVRSRSCYLLLKLVKALGSTLRPFVETAIGGIQGLLSNQTLSLHPDDTLYLFETIGLLLGRTTLNDDEQQRYLLAVASPHMNRIDSLLESPDLQRDPVAIGNNLAYAIASLAFLTKGLSSQISPGVQSILAETTHHSLKVLIALPSNDVLRNKIMIYLQRMILCLGEKVLVVMPHFLQILISQCTQEDLLDVAQLLNQLCFKFKERAIPIVDENLLHFLKRCCDLIEDINGKESVDILPPHLVTEQLYIKKIMFAFLYQVATSKCTPVLLSPKNIGSLEDILKTVGNGAITVPDPNMKKMCVQFFKELTNQWLVDSNDGSNTNIFVGFKTYLESALIPQVFNVFLQDSFNVKDAMQYRVVREMAGILSTLKLKCGLPVEQLIASTFVSRGCSHSDLLAIREAKSKNEMERSIKMLLNKAKEK